MDFFLNTPIFTSILLIAVAVVLVSAAVYFHLRRKLEDGEKQFKGRKKTSHPDIKPDIQKREME